MTGFAGIGGCNMVARFTGGLITIMTRCTIARYATVIESRVGERAGVVAILTGIAALDMIG